MRVWRDPEKVVTKATGSEGDIIPEMADSHSYKRSCTVLGVSRVRCILFRFRR